MNDVTSICPTSVAESGNFLKHLRILTNHFIQQNLCMTNAFYFWHFLLSGKAKSDVMSMCDGVGGYCVTDSDFHFLDYIQPKTLSIFLAYSYCNRER